MRDGAARTPAGLLAVVLLASAAGCGGHGGPAAPPSGGAAAAPQVAAAASAGPGGLAASGVLADPCSLLTDAQVAAVTGGMPAATPSDPQTDGAGCAYVDDQSMDEIDTTVAPLAGSPPCTVTAAVVAVTGVGACALFEADIHQLTVYGATDVATIDANGFAPTLAQLAGLGELAAARL